MHAAHGQDAILSACTKCLGLLKTGKEEETVYVPQLLTCDHGGAVQSPVQQRGKPSMHAVHGQGALLSARMVCHGEVPQSFAL